MILILFKPISVFRLLPLKHKDRNRVSLLPPFPKIILDKIFTEGKEFTDKEIYIRKHLTNIILILQFKEGKKSKVQNVCTVLSEVILHVYMRVWNYIHTNFKYIIFLN